jgi:hypothetical protein
MLIAINPCCRALGIAGGQVVALLAVIVSQITRMRCLAGLTLLCSAPSFVPAALGRFAVMCMVLVGRRLGLPTGPMADVALRGASGLVGCGLCTAAHLRAGLIWLEPAMSHRASQVVDRDYV